MLMSCVSHDGRSLRGSLKTPGGSVSSSSGPFSPSERLQLNYNWAFNKTNQNQNIWEQWACGTQSCPRVLPSRNMWSYLVRFISFIWVWTRVFTMFVSISFHAFLEKSELHPSGILSHTNQTTSLHCSIAKYMQYIFLRLYK